MGLTKTPEEIKKGLECCKDTHCEDCPYSNIRLCAQVNGIDAMNYIQQLEAQVPRWISVQEKLPENHKNVIVYMTNPIGLWKVQIDWMDEQGWVRNADSEWLTITHWMPMPQPPKEE